mgnify:CR=1 FL=1|jgi:hypothetical protein
MSFFKPVAARRELELTTTLIDPHTAIKTAIEHVRLLVDQREGTLNVSLDPMQIKLPISGNTISDETRKELEIAKASRFPSTCSPISTSPSMTKA